MINFNHIAPKLSDTLWTFKLLLNFYFKLVVVVVLRLKENEIKYKTECCLSDRLQISLLILSKFKQIN